MCNSCQVEQLRNFEPTQLQKHFHCHGPYSSPKEGHLAVRQQHSGGGSGVLAASVTWLRVDLMRVQKENLVIKEMEVSNLWGYPQISHL